MTLTPGTRLGPYEIQSVLGAGGMGEVYKAKDTRLGRTVAIKVLPEGAASDPERRRRFEQEARAASALNHPHICVVFDIGLQEGTDYLVMEHLEGETLATRLARGPLPLEQGLDVGTQIAEALSAAHKQGIIHRDLKPGNVMLTKEGAKLLDFGLAKLRTPETARGADFSSLQTQASPETEQGTILGTLAYMAPEQLEGKDADARSDLFSLGAVLYEMLTGTRAFAGASPASLISAVMSSQPTPLGTLQPLTPPLLERLVRQCLAKAPDDRPDTAHDVANDLRWMRETSGVITATPLGARRRARTVVPGIAGLIVGALLASFVIWRLWLPPAAAIVRSTIELPSGTRLSRQDSRFPTRTEFAFSPDGKYLAFSASSDGSGSGPALYLRALDSAAFVPIEGTEGARQPFFSPDGKWIGFWANGKLRKVPRQGGIAADLFVCPTAPKGAFWSEDGTILLGGGGGLRRIPADGGAAEVLTHIDPKRETEHTLPFLLPDGRTVLFTAMADYFGNRARVEAVPIGGGTRQLLIDDAADARYLQTGHIVFVRQGVLMAARLTPSRLDIGPAFPLVQGVEHALNVDSGGDHSGAAQYSVSVTGSLAYAAGGVGHLSENELLWVSRDGRAEALAGFDRSEVTNQVRLSADGRRLAFVQQAGPLWLFDLERATYARMSPDGLAAGPRWHPDGHRLTFAWSSAGRTQVWQVSVPEGSDTLKPLAVPEGAWPSSWSPDGRFLALVRSTNETRNDIAIYQAEDQKTVPFLDSRSSEAYPEFSPDGRWLAYGSDETGRPEVYLRSFPDPSRRVQISSQGGTQLSWSPDMREMFYVSLAPAKMMKVDLRLGPDVWVGRPQALFDFTFVQCGPVRGYDLDRDGQRFLFTRTKREPVADVTRINLIQNWFEELKAKVPAGR